MKLSRLSNRQLRRLLAQGEVRFGDEKEIKQIIASAVHTWGRLDSVFTSGVESRSVIY